MKFAPIDTIIFVLYGLTIVSIAYWVTRKKNKTSEDYFLAGKSLPWWAIGTSLIAANISAEQFIGMSGSGFAIGLAIASYAVDLPTLVEVVVSSLASQGVNEPIINKENL